MTLADTAAVAVADDGNVGSGKGPREKRPKRRTFTAEYKLGILEQYELLTEPGARGRCCARRVCTPRTSPSGSGCVTLER
ncbi:hypothetical protein NIIDMKKI_68620 [Mycobacterium kansasii]|uniref:Uncharacterized protein n=1 Tax=Mycobacterium kansasii TaxID=1768 RepID=A0A7G1IGX8_MYCKA|nr:hypothetical protein NIIDMKKI_12720 [Mycobacterium kansasii]BCI86075.1 hypothetical protein NIIDMKKI_12810 [Mycobacterium kansasii]BCI87129.1 hypothetical protein NIIDMKKI_23350 [Mycobacterium kansasii]BCI89423.1 hypothetical protein NIIDMKKI_46290 [Mycobacterium kansasii]BCI89426.1 hypothetical protein NIIDMKKI_46320 [Mycobacterium kansasii]